MTTAQVAALDAAHQPDAANPAHRICQQCGGLYPCEARLLLDHFAAFGLAIAEHLREEHGGMVGCVALAGLSTSGRCSSSRWATAGSAPSGP